ncbi:MAG: extracellular solute-binding protein [Sulfolobaceae archaeon]
MKKTLFLLIILCMIIIFNYGQAPITLSIWSGYPEMEPLYKIVANEFIEKHPNVKIEILTMPLRDYERRLALTIPAGTAGDILEVSYSTMFRYINAGFISPAPESIANFVKSGAWARFFVNAASYKSKIYGVPLFRGQCALFYNTKMFREAGLKRPPRTMKEYTDYAIKLTKRDSQGNPIVSGWSLRLTGGGQGIAEKFWINLHQWGGALLKQTPDGKWTTDFVNDAGIKTLQQYVDLVNKYKTVTPEMKADAEAFELELTAMFIRESWVIGDIAQKAPKLEYATAYLPRGTITLPVNLYVYTKDKQKSELAWEFVKLLVEPKYQLWLAENIGWLPNRQDIDYSYLISKIPQFKAFLEIPKGYVLFSLPPIAPIEEILTKTAEKLVKAYTDKSLVDNPEGIKKVLEDIDKEIKNILAREGLLSSK